MKNIERRLIVAGADTWVWPQGVDPVVRQVLSRRPLGSSADMALDLAALRPIGEFGALAAAVELLCAHRNNKIVVVGDFDADGATSTALVVLCLRDLGFAQVDYFIPDRFELGYGLTPEVVARTQPLAPTLIVTVDNGVTSVAGVAAARAAGIDVLVTDHHLAGPVLPAANVLVNPNLPGDPFAGKHLAGVGVAFYLLAALGKALGVPKAVLHYLDLVALGTVADLVRLDRSNRILVEQGLRRIRAGQCRPGLAALIEVAGGNLDATYAATLGYQVGPRLNAAGRLADMSIGVRCLVAADDGEARGLAAELDQLNRQRRELEAGMREEAMTLLEEVTTPSGQDMPRVVCLRHSAWHQGLIGLVASRVKERCSRPVVAFAPAHDGRLRGSGRSIAGFHLRDALAEVDAGHPGLMERFGGHAMAAGLTLAPDAFDEFEQAINSVAAERLDLDALAGAVLTDGELAAGQLNVRTAAALRDAGPWGQGFPEPSFDGCFKVVSRRVLKDAHLKMKLEPSTGGMAVDAIAFNCIDATNGTQVPPEGATLQVAYRLGINTYFETPRVELFVDWMAPSVERVALS